METTQKSKLPATVELNGRTYVLNKFQAADFVAVVQKHGNASATMLTIGLLARVADCNGAALTEAEILRMKASEMGALVGHLTASATITSTGNDTTTGTLPSGKAFTLREPLVSDSLEAEKAPAEHRVYMMVCLCCTIDGQPIERHDAEIMDGQDFMSLAELLNASPR